MKEYRVDLHSQIFGTYYVDAENEEEAEAEARNEFEYEFGCSAADYASVEDIEIVQDYDEAETVTEDND